MCSISATGNAVFARLMLKCWSPCILVGKNKISLYFQQGHCPASNKSVACPRQDLQGSCYPACNKYTCVYACPHLPTIVLAILTLYLM